MKFRMVDRILAYEPHRSIRGIKAVSFEEYRLRAAVDVQPQLPASLLLQSLVELGNWLLILSSDFTRNSHLVSLDRVEFHSALRPGEQLLIDVTLCHHDDRTAHFTGRGRTTGRDIITVTAWQSSLLPLSQYFSPDDLRVLFSEIHRPEVV
jgi:3-hydroxyacyl-[acyl-carrier-protein] dehydratase